MACLARLVASRTAILGVGTQQLRPIPVYQICDDFDQFTLYIPLPAQITDLHNGRRHQRLQRPRLVAHPYVPYLRKPSKPGEFQKSKNTDFYKTTIHCKCYFFAGCHLSR